MKGLTPSSGVSQWQKVVNLAASMYESDGVNAKQKGGEKNSLGCMSI